MLRFNAPACTKPNQTLTCHVRTSRIAASSAFRILIPAWQVRFCNKHKPKNNMWSLQNSTRCCDTRLPLIRRFCMRPGPTWLRKDPLTLMHRNCTAWDQSPHADATLHRLNFLFACLWLSLLYLFVYEEEFDQGPIIDVDVFLQGETVSLAHFLNSNWS